MEVVNLSYVRSDFWVIFYLATLTKDVFPGLAFVFFLSNISIDTHSSSVKALKVPKVRQKTG